jgi:hypothetical protein
VRTAPATCWQRCLNAQEQVKVEDWAIFDLPEDVAHRPQAVAVAQAQADSLVRNEVWRRLRTPVSQWRPASRAACHFGTLTASSWPRA